MAQNPENPFNNDTEKLSYSIGVNFGEQLKEQGIELNTEILSQGLADVLNNHPQRLSADMIKQTLTKFQRDQFSKTQALSKKVGEKNLAEAQAFLKENQAKAQIKTLSSGLQYEVISEGTGSSPKLKDLVTVHYRGTLINGKEFDNSYLRGKPATFPVNGVISGWTEALQLMKPGAKWKLYIPPALGYGEHGAGDTITPNSLLIFDVELLGVNDQTPGAGQDDIDEEG